MLSICSTKEKYVSQKNLIKAAFSFIELNDCIANKKK